MWKVVCQVAVEPVPQPRHRVTTRPSRSGLARRPAVYLPSDHPVHVYKQLLRLAVSQSANELPMGDLPMAGPMAVCLNFVCSVKGKFAGYRLHSGRPDVDNYVKAALDAIKGVVWVDDAQVVKVTATKWKVARSDLACVGLAIMPMQDNPEQQSYAMMAQLLQNPFEAPVLEKSELRA